MDNENAQNLILVIDEYEGFEGWLNSTQGPLTDEEWFELELSLTIKENE